MSQRARKPRAHAPGDCGRHRMVAAYAWTWHACCITSHVSHAVATWCAYRSASADRGIADATHGALRCDLRDSLRGRSRSERLQQLPVRRCSHGGADGGRRRCRRRRRRRANALDEGHGRRLRAARGACAAQRESVRTSASARGRSMARSSDVPLPWRPLGARAATCALDTRKKCRQRST